MGCKAAVEITRKQYTVQSMKSDHSIHISELLEVSPKGEGGRHLPQRHAEKNKECMA